MSDPSRPLPQKPAMPAGVFQNLSPMNPSDAKLMAASGQLSPDMTVRDYLGKMGVDVDGPVTQLLDMGKRMQENADPMMKMKNIAASASSKPGGMSMMGGGKPPAAPMGQPGPAGLEGLVKKLGR